LLNFQNFDKFSENFHENIAQFPSFPCLSGHKVIKAKGVNKWSIDEAQRKPHSINRKSNKKPLVSNLIDISPNQIQKKKKMKSHKTRLKKIPKRKQKQ
jgi:hypothetical protein